MVKNSLLTQVLIAVVSLLILSACSTMQPPRYAVSVDNILKLKTYKGAKVSVASLNQSARLFRPSLPCPARSIKGIYHHRRQKDSGTKGDCPAFRLAAFNCRGKGRPPAAGKAGTCPEAVILFWGGDIVRESKMEGTLNCYAP